MLIKIVGIDISLNNLGASQCLYDTEREKLTIQQVGTFCPCVSKNKQVRQNSKDLEQGLQLYQALLNVCKDAQVICVEIPHGSQSARAMASYGICIGVLSALKQNSKAVFIEVSALEVKQTVGKPNATKKEVVAWVLQQHPHAPLSTYKGEINMTKAEHQADSIVAIYAGMKTEVFKTFYQILKDTPQ